VVNGDLCHSVRFRKAQVYGDADALFLILAQSAPESYASACLTKVELKRLTAHIRLRRASDLDAFIFVVICPEHAISPACRTVAGRSAVRLAFKLPPHCATQAGTFNHLRLAFRDFRS
jgi:hypothetical protein